MDPSSLVGGQSVVQEFYSLTVIALALSWLFMSWSESGLLGTPIKPLFVLPLRVLSLARQKRYSQFLHFTVHSDPPGPHWPRAV